MLSLPRREAIVILVCSTTANVGLALIPPPCSTHNRPTNAGDIILIIRIVMIIALRSVLDKHIIILSTKLNLKVGRFL